MSDKLHIQDIPWPDAVVKLQAATGCKLVRCCVANGWLTCLVTIDAGLFHMSVSHPRRYPTWDELKALRYTLLPDAKTFAILFPPMAQYVNLHPNCFHFHEVPELHQP